MDSAGDQIRKFRKDIRGWKHLDRNAQVENIATLYLVGRVRSSTPLVTFNHVFPSFAAGVLNSPGIYDSAHLPVLESD